MGNNPTATGDHIHEPTPEAGHIRKTVTEMKRRAEDETTPVTQIYKTEAAKLAGGPSAPVLPAFLSVGSSLYRKRHRKYPSLPQSLDEVAFPDDMLETSTGENFLLIQTNTNSLLVFGEFSSDFYFSSESLGNVGLIVGKCRADISEVTPVHSFTIIVPPTNVGNGYLVGGQFTTYIMCPCKLTIS